MNVIAIDPLTGIAIRWLQSFLADWGSPCYGEDSDRATVQMALRAAEFFRHDFPRLTAAEGRKAIEREPNIPSIASVLSHHDMTAAERIVSRWADTFDMPVTKFASDWLCLRLAQHLAGTIFDAIARLQRETVDRDAWLTRVIESLIQDQFVHACDRAEFGRCNDAR